MILFGTACAGANAMFIIRLGGMNSAVDMVLLGVRSQTRWLRLIHFKSVMSSLLLLVPPSITTGWHPGARERVRETESVALAAGEDRVRGWNAGFPCSTFLLCSGNTTLLKLSDSHATQVPPCRSIGRFGLPSVLYLNYVITQ